MIGYRDFFDVLKLINDDAWYLVDAEKGSHEFQVLSAMKQLGLISVEESEEAIDQITITKRGKTFYDFLIRKGKFNL